MLKSTIVQRLLDNKHITAEEAVVLLQIELQYVPQYPLPPIQPLWPNNPGWVPSYPQGPFITYSHTGK